MKRIEKILKNSNIKLIGIDKIKVKIAIHSAITAALCDPELLESFKDSETAEDEDKCIRFFLNKNV